MLKIRLICVSLSPKFQRVKELSYRLSPMVTAGVSKAIHTELFALQLGLVGSALVMPSPLADILTVSINFS